MAGPAGYSIVYYAEYAPGTTDYSTLILDAQAAGADMLLAMPTTPDGIAIVKQMPNLAGNPSSSISTVLLMPLPGVKPPVPLAMVCHYSLVGITVKNSRVWQN